MKQVIVAILLVLLADSLSAQLQVTTSLLTTNDGLSQGYIFGILQSRDGFMWFATKDGLNRYDGSRFVVFSHDPFNPYSIANSEVRSVFEDSRGWIWVSFMSGLDVLDPATGRFYHVFEDEDEKFSTNGGVGRTTVSESSDGTIWVWSKEGIWKVRVPENALEMASKKGSPVLELSCKLIPKPPGSNWSSHILHSNNKLLISAYGGLLRVDAATETILPEISTPGYQYADLVGDRQGSIFGKVVNLNGDQLSWVLMDQNGTQSTLFTNKTGCYTIGPDGNLWLYSEGHLQKWKVSAFFNHGKPEFDLEIESKIGNSGGGVTLLKFDKSGLLWLGTGGYGILKINLNSHCFHNYLPRNSQRRLLEAPDGGIFCMFEPAKKYPSKSFQFTSPHTDFSHTGYNYDGTDGWGGFSACFDAAGNGWSTNRGLGKLFRADATTKAVTSFPWEQASGLIVDRKGELLSVSAQGLMRFDPKTETSKVFPFARPQKTASVFSHFLYEDADGIIWIFGFEGLTKATPDASGYQYTYFTNNPTDRSSLTSNIVLSVADDPVDPKLYLWVGTKNGGLNRLDKKTGRFKQFKTENGIPDNVVYGILSENKGPYIWLSTNKGLCRFHVREETTRNFKAADGLPDNEFNSSSYLKLRDGAMIFGGIKGLTLFYPDSLGFNQNIPQVHIVGLQVNNQPVSGFGFGIPDSGFGNSDDWAGNRKSEIENPKSQPLVLAHDQNLLNFEFAALEFTNPAQNQYRYQLEGVHKDWVPLGNKNSIQFANLAPGTYTFRVQGSNNDGMWSEQAAEFRFTIRPPWWNSWWAWLIYLVILAAGIWQYYQYLLRRRFADQEKLRLQALDDFKSRFFTNITHEFRTPLTVILGMSDRVLSDGVTSSHPVTIAQPVSLIKRSGENLLRLVNQILDLAKLESNALKMNYIQGDVLAFIRYIAESLHSLANAQNLMLRVESDEVKIVMDYDPERLLQIVHNLLSNAVKFTPSGGRVVLRAGVRQIDGRAWLDLQVSDNGAGIPPDELPQLFERFFQARNQEHAKAGGTGIGLSLTRELVKAMGGQIRVESTLGAGSTFFVLLPVTNNSLFEEKAVDILKTPAPRRLPVASASDEDSEKRHILLIEDNPDVVEYLNACLKDTYQLEFAYNGQAGIEKALESVPDLIVSDVMMPFKDGFEVVDALKNDERSSHIPIILLTAKADVQSRLSGLRKGADAYLSKPFHQEELTVTVENLLETRRKLQLKYQHQILTPEIPASPDAASAIEDVFLQKVRAIIDAHYTEDDFGLPQLCQKIGMSRSQLFRKMKALTDIAPSDLIRTHRLNKAKALLESGQFNVAETAWEVGFKDPSYFTKLYQEAFGIAPSATRK